MRGEMEGGERTEEKGVKKGEKGERSVEIGRK